MAQRKSGGDSDKMAEVRSQVTRFLGAAQQGELGDLVAFLDEFAAKTLAEERKSFGLGPGDESDDDDYPQGHFKEAPNEKKPPHADRLKMHQRDAVRDFRDGNGRSALHFATSSNAPGCDAVAQHILDIFPQAHALVDDNGATPIILAAEVTGTSVAKKMVELLLNANADAGASDKHGVQALHHAAGGGREDVISLLHSKGAPLDVSSGAGTPLHWAAGEGKAVAVEMLVGLGAAVDAANAQGLTPIIMAAARGSGVCVAALAAKGADVGFVLGGGLTVLHICAEMGLSEAVTALIATPTGKACALKPSDAGKLPIQLAAEAGQEAVVRLLQPVSYDTAAAADGGGAAAAAVPSLPAPSVEEIMAQGAKAVAEGDAQDKSAEAARAALGSAPSPSLIENTKPAASPEAATAAQAAKDRGNACFGTKDYEGATAAYTEAVKLDGTDAVFFSNRSAAWLELATSAEKEETPAAAAASAPEGRAAGLRQRALADAEYCRRLKPDWAKACYRMAAARMACGLFEDAAVSAFEGLKLDDTNAALRKIMKEAVAKGREEHFK